MDVARIARGKVELRTSIVEISDMVTKAVEMASPLIEQRSHNLRVNVPNRGLRVSADPTRMSQVISNLLTNAAKYTAPRGQITIRAEQVGGDVVLRMHNTGIGIALRYCPGFLNCSCKIGRPATVRREGWASGWQSCATLSSPRRIRFGRERRPGPGKRVYRAAAWVAHTDAVAAPAAIPAESARAALRATAPRVLVVDDNEDGSMMLAKALALRGHDTRVVHDAPTALRRCGGISAGGGRGRYRIARDGRL